ncbi:MAG: UbiA prenyltransferase family protein, partial [Gammaproteobacteria bacterium]
MKRLFALGRLMRPHQWIKNGFVFTGLLFAHRWNEPDMLWRVVLAAAAFCLVSSVVYVLNDIADRERDRSHPTKCRRPVASGEIPVAMALGFWIILLAGGMGLGVLAGFDVVPILLVYFFLNLAYSLRLKQVVILDVFIIAAGFMLRILAGTLGVGIPPSQWLLLTGLMLTLFL